MAFNENLRRNLLDNLDKLTFLRAAGVEDWALEMLNPNCLKFLAHVARKSNTQTLQRALDERRYPILIAFLSQALTCADSLLFGRWRRPSCLALSEAGGPVCFSSLSTVGRKSDPAWIGFMANHGLRRTRQETSLRTNWTVKDA